MSDTYSAPDAPPPNEVTITPPEGQPDAPVSNRPGDAPAPPPKAPAPTRQEAIAKAMEKVKNGEKDGDEPKAKQAKGQEREIIREKGRFAKGQQTGEPDGEPGQQTGQEIGRKTGQETGRETGQPLLNYREPPRRFDDVAKKDWNSTPESVRANVHRVQQEFQQYHERAKPDLEAFHEIREFHEMAKQHGTTLKTAVDGYWKMEQRLRGGDVVGGIAQIIDNLGLTTSNGQKLTLRDFAHYVATMDDNQYGQVIGGNRTSQIDARTQQTMTRIEHLEQKLAEQEYNGRLKDAEHELELFKARAPRWSELVQVVEQEMSLGWPLDKAYERAEKLYPSSGRQSGGTHAAQTGTAAAQTRANGRPDPGTRSISGAPEDVSTRELSARERREGGAKVPTRQEALLKAMRKVGVG